MDWENICMRRNHNENIVCAMMFGKQAFHTTNICIPVPRETRENFVKTLVLYVMAYTSVKLRSGKNESLWCERGMGDWNQLDEHEK